jgi:hypothetical protein
MHQAKVICPHCQTEQLQDTRLCAHCGTIMMPQLVSDDHSQCSPARIFRKSLLVTNYAIVDFILGFVVSIVLMPFGIGIILAPVCYFLYRSTKPYFACGAGVAFLSTLLLLLSVFLTCKGDVR